MKKKKVEKKGRFSLTAVFSLVVFALLLATMVLISILAFVLDVAGILHQVQESLRLRDVIFIVALISLLLGTMISFIAARIPLKPLNTVINAMNRLASGDFRIRLHSDSDSPWSKHPTWVEFNHSFNTLAEELENTEMLRSDFVNNFSHEFKTPIVSINGFARLLKQPGISDAQKEEYVDIIEQESMRLSAMAYNVLNLTKVENQTILSDVSHYNLSEQIRECFLLLEQLWSAKNLELDLDFEECYIDGNKELLEQVWLNLIDNAVKFCPEEGTIRVSIEELGGMAVVDVINTGNHIAPENLERIFGKFYQEDTSHSTKGNGVGLAIVKSVCELHEGSVEAKNVMDGVCFTVTLPVMQ